MMKATRVGTDGRVHVVLGITDRESKRLFKDKPLLIDGDKLRLPPEYLVCIAWQHDDKQIMTPQSPDRKVLVIPLTEKQLRRPSRKKDSVAVQRDVEIGKGFRVLVLRGKNEQTLMRSMAPFLGATTKVIGKLPKTREK
jgi:hypothetical protein